MFRIPSWSDLVALFWHPTTVDGAIRGIKTAAKHAEGVIAFNGVEAQRARNRALKARQRAARHDGDASEHQAEADRALRVSQKLNDLVA
jgi:hypothetical protein